MHTELTSSSVQTKSESVILTWEQLFYGIVLACAAILRLGNLGLTPLSPAEAENSWGVWLFWQPEAADRLPEISSSAWFSLTAFLTQVIGDSDVVMRLIPALAGIGAVLAIVRFRPFTGRMGGIVSAIMLALSPLLVSISRTADGNSLAILALIMVTGFWLQFRHTEEPRSLNWLAAWLAFGLITSPVFYSGIFAFGLAWLLEKFVGPQLKLGGYWPEGDVLRRAGITFVAVFAIASTMFLLNPAGIGIAAGTLEAWVGAFGGYSRIADIGNPVFTLLQYEMVLIAMAMIIMISMSILGDPESGFLGYWLVASVLLFMLQVGENSNALIALIPAALLVGRAFDQTVARIPLDRIFSTYPDGGMGFPMAGISIVLLLIGATYLGRFSRTGLETNSGRGLLFLCAMILALIVLMAIFISVYDQLSAITGLLLVGLTLSAVFSWSVAWRLGGEQANDSRQLWVEQGTDDELFLLNDTLRETGSSTIGLEEALEIYSTVDIAVLRWYLRDYDDVQFFDAIPAGATPDIIITPDGVEVQAGSDYTGTDFGLIRPDQTLNLTFTQNLRWWLFGDSTAPIQDQRIVLWVRANLITNQ
ncbi:MAG: glycosyltransferase family 39 protein [Anaerolineae bacterium]